MSELSGHLLVLYIQGSFPQPEDVVFRVRRIAKCGLPPVALCEPGHRAQLELRSHYNASIYLRYYNWDSGVGSRTSLRDHHTPSKWGFLGP
nr:hypothetical protein CFP56_48727 [Quercus suber]